MTTKIIPIMLWIHVIVQANSDETDKLEKVANTVQHLLNPPTN